MREPYDKTTAQTGSGYNHPSWWAARGWVTVVQDCRGRFRSEGEFDPFVNEAKDGYDAVEWAARLDGVDGRVATYGFSYPGATQLLAATERPPSLVAICPGMTASQYYEGWTYQGGALHLAFAANWAAGLACVHGHRPRRRAGDHPARGRRRQRRLVLAPTAAEPPGLRREDAPYYFDWIEHPDVRRLLARDRDRRGLRADRGARAARRRVVRRLPVGHGRELPRSRRPAEAARRTVAARALDPAARRRRRRRRPSPSTTGSCASSTRWSRDVPPASSTRPPPCT